MVIKKANNDSRRGGFTLAEVIIAMMVTSIILSAVAALAFAMGSANESTKKMGKNQARIRFATVRIAELIRHSKLICAAPGDDIVIWKADNDGDGRIDVIELAYIEAGAGRDYINLLEFVSCPAWVNSLLDADQINYLKVAGNKNVLVSNCDTVKSVLINQCGNVTYYLDRQDKVPQSRLVSILFDVEENGINQNYQITAALAGWAGHLLDSSGEQIVSGGDDD